MKKNLKKVEHVHTHAHTYMEHTIHKCLVLISVLTARPLVPLLGPSAH